MIAASRPTTRPSASIRTHFFSTSAALRLKVDMRLCALKRKAAQSAAGWRGFYRARPFPSSTTVMKTATTSVYYICLLYTSDAADEEDSVDLGGRRIIKKKK